jgi:triosephosphate isomerase
MRKKIIAGNWKMNKTPSEAVQLAAGLVKSIGNEKDCDVVVCPTFTALTAVRDIIKGSQIKLGAQDMYWEESGAYTGEISAKMLLDSGCTYVILGHSERRALFGETNETVNKKVKAAHKNGLLPIMCVGETWEERQAGKKEAVIGEQVLKGLEGLTEAELINTIIAYEPVWAIGVGKTPATAEQAEEVHKFIRGLLAKHFCSNVASQMRIQYGGNVSDKNVEELMKIEDIDGGLVGGASLKVDVFSFLVTTAAKLK